MTKWITALITYLMTTQAIANVSLTCELYDLATAQIIESGTLELKRSAPSTLTLEWLGMKAQVIDEPIDNGLRQQSLFIDNFLGQMDKKYFVYDPQTADTRKFPHVVSEAPGLGDTMFFYCR